MVNLPTLSVRAPATHSPAQHLQRAAELADLSAGLTAPHPNAGCVIAHGPRVVGEGFLYAQGTKSAEVQSVERARNYANGAVAYLNLEPGDCHGDDSAVNAMKLAGVSKVVVGLRHPMMHLRGKAINALRSVGIPVDILGEDQMDIHGDRSGVEEALQSCHQVNAPLLCRENHRIPFSVLKFAMTLDGKIACSSGHASWISSPESRKRVFETRGRCDAVIVGGSTVRRDNPRLTTRQNGGHVPVRIVMSRGLDLPDDRHLWNVTEAPTIVMTQRGAPIDFQSRLAARGVEVVEFDILTPMAVTKFCYNRGYLSLLWECGGNLSAPAISAGLIHQVQAFVAPKIIGGVGAPSPVGELGMVAMTQALNLSDVSFKQSGPDMLVTGYLKSIPRQRPSSDAAAAPSVADIGWIPAYQAFGPGIISFHKTWEPFGALSNYSPHPISMADAAGSNILWRSVEHYWQAQRFAGVQDSLAEDFTRQIQSAQSPEEAARLGQTFTRARPDLVRSDWEYIKMGSMYNALRAKLVSHPSLQKMLLSTAGSVLVEDPRRIHGGRAATAVQTERNNLGFLLMGLRSEFFPETRGDSSDPSSLQTADFAST